MGDDKFTSGQSGLSGFGAMIRGRSKFGVVALALWLAYAAGGLCVSVARADPAKTASGPADLLSDGFDALDAGRTDLARKIFETILSSYPRSTQAAAASEALTSLDDEGGINDDTAAAGYPTDDTEARKPVRADAVRADNGLDASLDITPGKRLPRAQGGLIVSAEQMRRTRNRFLIDVGDRVFFAQNSAVLGGRARAVVESQARWLKKMPSLQVTVVGRAADGGSSKDDADLSLARARAVEAKLIEGGVPATRIRVEARGNTDPVATCANALCQAQNRHAESLISYAGMGTSQLTEQPAGAMAIELPASAPARPLPR
jgi:peptidoglycan-associated lipoprotein